MAHSNGQMYGGPFSDSFLRSKGHREMVALYNKSFSRFKNELTGAASSVKETKFLQGAFPGPETWTTGDPVAAWDTLIDDIADLQDMDNLQYVDRDHDQRKTFRGLRGQEEYQRETLDELRQIVGQTEPGRGVPREAHQAARMAKLKETYDVGRRNKKSVGAYIQTLNELEKNERDALDRARADGDAEAINDHRVGLLSIVTARDKLSRVKNKPFEPPRAARRTDEELEDMQRRHYPFETQ